MQDIDMVNFCRTTQPTNWLIFVVPLSRNTTITFYCFLYVLKIPISAKFLKRFDIFIVNVKTVILQTMLAIKSQYK